MTMDSYHPEGHDQSTRHFNADKPEQPVKPPHPRHQLTSLPARVLAMCKARNWSLHWTARGAYLHLESSELIEVTRGKNLQWQTREERMKQEAADVLLVLMSITESNGIDWTAVVEQASSRCDELMTTADEPYAGEERLPAAAGQPVTIAGLAVQWQQSIVRQAAKQPAATRPSTSCAVESPQGDAPPAVAAPATKELPDEPGAWFDKMNQWLVVKSTSKDEISGGYRLSRSREGVEWFGLLTMPRGNWLKADVLPAPAGEMERLKAIIKRYEAMEPKIDEIDRRVRDHIATLEQRLAVVTADRDQALMQLPQHFRQHTTGLREGVKRLVDYYDSQAATIRSLDEDRLKLINETASMRQDTEHARRIIRSEWWSWQGDGTDELDSLGCPVIIQPRDLQALLDETSIAEQRATAAEAELARVTARLECFDGCYADMSFAADKILNHFTDDGQLKGDGNWRIAEIYKACRRIDQLFGQCVKELNSLTAALNNTEAGGHND